MFKAWQKSIGTRFIIDAIFIIIVSISLQYEMTVFQTKATKFYNIVDDFTAKRDALKNTSLTPAERAAAQASFDIIEKQFLNINNNAYDNLLIIYYIYIVMLAYVIRNVCQIIFARLRNKSWKVIAVDVFLSAFQLFLTGLVLIRHYCISQYENPADSRYYKAMVIDKDYHYTFLNMTEVSGYFMVIQWIRVLFLFKPNYIFGPMINILNKMIETILKFLIIYGMFFLIFASSGSLLFNSIPAFQDRTSTIVTLFSASLGNFSFSIFDDPSNAVSKSNWIAYLILFLLISNVVLLNFIITILSSVYDELRAQSKSIYLAEVVKLRSVFGYNEYYSSMISLPIPLNLFIVPFVPFLIIFKSKKLNLVLLHACYVPVLLIAILVFFTISVILTPFAYISLIYQNVNHCTAYRLSPKGRFWTLCYMLLSIFKDPFLLLVITFINTMAFTKSLYTKKLTKHKENAFSKLTDLRNLDKRYFDNFKATLGKYKNSLVDIKKLIRDLMAELGVIQHIRDMIYNHKADKSLFVKESSNVSYEALSKEFSMIKNSSEETQKTSLYIIKQFNLLKKFIVNNSIPYDSLTFQSRSSTSHPNNEWSTKDVSELGEKAYEYDLNAIKRFKQNKIKKRRVIDASKVLKIIHESEEQSYFRYIINSRGVITIDKEINKKQIGFSTDAKEKLIVSDFDKLRWKLWNSKDPKIHLMSISNNYSALEKICVVK